MTIAAPSTTRTAQALRPAQILKSTAHSLLAVLLLLLAAALGIGLALSAAAHTAFAWASAGLAPAVERSLGRRR